MNLLTAFNQWHTRPADQRFWTLEDMLKSCQAYRRNAASVTRSLNSLNMGFENNELLLLGENNQARFSNWAFSQLTQRMGSPAGYLRSLPVEKVADILNFELQRQDRDVNANILFHRNGSDLISQAFTSDKYSRIWNADLLSKLVDVQNDGWTVPKARAVDGLNSPGARLATAADITDRTINLRVGQPIAPAGLYASDSDMFVFMVNENVSIDDGTEQGLARGVFVSNSEVGKASLRITRFLYRHVCGNHIVWDAKDVKEIRLIHRGSIGDKYRTELVAELTKFSNESTSEIESIIDSKKRVIIGNNKDEIIKAIFGEKKLLPKTIVSDAYQAAIVESDTHGDFAPGSVWGMVQGLTEVSKGSTFTNKRVEIDRAAGRLMQIAF